MAKRKTGRKGKTAKRRSRRWTVKLAAVLALAAMLYCAVPASVTRVRHADVTVKDLPASFDGLTILYLTDIDICGSRTVSDLRRACSELAHFESDIVFVGGDLVSAGLFARLNGQEASETVRIAVLDALTVLKPKLGFFLVSGENDGDTAKLGELAASRGITLLDGRALALNRGSDRLMVAGIGNGSRVDSIAQSVKRDDCVLLMSHTPDRLADVRVNEAKDGGVWADMILCGHTHGGQVVLFDRPMLNLTEREKQYREGWFNLGVPILVSSGFGCEAINMRIGTQSEVWLLRLHCST